MRISSVGLLAVLIAAFAVISPTFAQDATPEVTPDMSAESTPELTPIPAASDDAIVLNRPAFSPEGVEYDPINGRFLVGSLTEGSIFAIGDDGTVTPFIEDADIKGSIGIQVDADRNRLLVTNSDPAPFSNPEAQGSIMLGIYDLSSGERLNMVDLNAIAPEGRHVVNDVAVDADGNAYVTDSFSPVIYKVDYEGVASIFVQDDRLSNEMLGLNGIAYHPDGYLIASVTGAGKLYKIPLDNPEGLTEVMLEQPIGGDGLTFSPDGSSLYIVGGDTQSVYSLTSDDDWQSATVAGTYQASNMITTVTVKDDMPYVLYTSFDPAAPEGSYQIVPVEFM